MRNKIVISLDMASILAGKNRRISIRINRIYFIIAQYSTVQCVAMHFRGRQYRCGEERRGPGRAEVENDRG